MKLRFSCAGRRVQTETKKVSFSEETLLFGPRLIEFSLLWTLLIQIVNAYLFDQEIKGLNLRSSLVCQKDEVQTETKKVSLSEETLLFVPPTY